MKKILFLSATVLLCGALVPTADAKKDYRGGFVGPQANVEVVTVAQVKKMSDDSKVVLKGNIVSSLGGEHYIFKDATGSIDVEIEKNRWHGLTVTPNDEVRLMGELDKHWFEEPSVDVSDINIVQPMTE